MKLEEFEALFAESLVGLGLPARPRTGVAQWGAGGSDTRRAGQTSFLTATGKRWPSRWARLVSATFGYRPWADLLGLAVDADLDVKEQAEFLLGHAQQIENAIEHDPQIGDRLRSSNWRFVKEYLGLDPDMRRPGEAEGS
jgi:hypothetical protein